MVGKNTYSGPKNIKFVQRFSEKVFANNNRIHIIWAGHSQILKFIQFILKFSFARQKSPVIPLNREGRKLLVELTLI